MSRLRVRGGSCLTGEMQWRKAKAPDRCDNLPSGWPSYGGIFDLDAKRETLKQLDEAGLRAEVDDRQEKIGYKIREAQLQKIPYMLVIGDREAAEGTVAVRTRAGGDQGAQSVEAFVSAALAEVRDRK